MTDTWYYHSAREKGMKRMWARFKKLETSLELVWMKKVSPGFRLHIGNESSETPVDWNVSAYWFAAFGSWNFPGLGKACATIGGGHKRDISLKFHGGQMWWKLWYDDDMGYDDYHKCDAWRKPKLYPWRWGREKYRGWMCLRNGNIELNPVSAFYGSTLWLKDETFPAQVVQAAVDINDFPNDKYVVEFTLERRLTRRKAGPKWARRIMQVDYSASASCTPGIPVRNHDWKGDEILGWSVRVAEENALRDEWWVSEAIEGTKTQVRRDRKHYNYHPPRIDA